MISLLYFQVLFLISFPLFPSVAIVMVVLHLVNFKVRGGFYVGHFPNHQMILPFAQSQIAPGCPYLW